MKKIILYLILMFVVASPATASDPVWFSCDKIDSVAGMDGWQPRLEIGALGDFDGKNYFIINGWLEVPSTGYGYEFELWASKEGTQFAQIILKEPSIGADVISKLPINKRFAYGGKRHKILIEVKKNFNWGPKIISCKLDM